MSASHGTYGRYQRHRKEGSKVCEPCRIAARDYSRKHRMLKRGDGVEWVDSISISDESSTKEWRPVLNFESFYAISETGELKRIRVGSRGGHGLGLKVTPIDTRGYRKATLFVDGVATGASIHVLVCEAFHGPRPEGTVVRHLDGNPLNNSAGNLCWGTQSENGFDTVRHGNNRNSNKTHCLLGHPLVWPNLTPARWFVYGHRTCRACAVAKEAARQAKLRGLPIDLQLEADLALDRIYRKYRSDVAS